MSLRPPTFSRECRVVVQRSLQPLPNRHNSLITATPRRCWLRRSPPNNTDASHGTESKSDRSAATAADNLRLINHLLWHAQDFHWTCRSHPSITFRSHHQDLMRIVLSLYLWCQKRTLSGRCKWLKQVQNCV